MLKKTTLDLFRTVGWKISFWSFVALGSFLCLYIVSVFALRAYGTLETKFTRLELPGGAYFAPASLFPHPNPWFAEIAFFHADGRMLRGPDAEQICVGEQYVLVKPRSPDSYYLYQVGAEDVMTLDDPGYSELWYQLEGADGLACFRMDSGWSHYAELLQGNTITKTRFVWPWSSQ